MRLDAVATVLVPFCINSFVIGRQFLPCVGYRVLGRKRGQDFSRDRKDTPLDGKYVIMRHAPRDLYDELPGDPWQP